jgi:hypothetical protein
MEIMESVFSAWVCRSCAISGVGASDPPLHLDSGGPGTYSQLLILKEYASRLATDLGISEDDVYLADYFDLMGGVGFGGYVRHSIL